MAKTSKGHIQQLPSGSFRVKVCAGTDPVTGKPRRYRRYARRVGIASSLKELRHYSATQLLAAGTDLNTVAGRLGHAEGPLGDGVRRLGRAGRLDV